MPSQSYRVIVKNLEDGLLTTTGTRFANLEEAECRVAKVICQASNLLGLVFEVDDFERVVRVVQRLRLCSRATTCQGCVVKVRENLEPVEECPNWVAGLAT